MSTTTQTTVQQPSLAQKGVHGKQGAVEQFHYDNETPRRFAMATILWMVVAFLVGIWAAFELAFPALNFETRYITFSRIRPLHTNAAIFAFVGNAIFAGIYYSIQRLLKARLYSKFISNFHFWGWQLIIVGAAISLPLGFNSSKEYAELEWPFDIAIALVWIAFGVNMMGTIMKRRVRHMYVAIWFYIATFVTVALLHVINSLALPVTFMKSYSLYAGVQDALVQWWYGHNAVAFFLTTPFLGLMYYYLPKAANRPVYSYRLSIVHFWALIFVYIWAGPHHLLYSSLPQWAQSVGTVFSIILIAPSWGGMINGLLTLRGAWDKVRQDPILKFFVVGVTAYGMATFEGPMHSLKNVNAFTHFTDWIPAHVHVGTLGWNGFMTFGMLYWMIPRMFGTRLFSQKLANIHFWIGSLGIIFWAVPMYWAGTVQGLMWKQFTADGFLEYPNFLETVTQIVPMFILRGIGGVLYLTGALVMVYNLIKTMSAGKFIKEERAEAVPYNRKYNDEGLRGYFRHRILERKPMAFMWWALFVVAIGGAVEFLPVFVVESNIPQIAAVKPYTPLELEGRDVYIREGCNNCHSQMVRPFRSETERFGEYSKAGEYVYDHPHLWGSKRTGPDLMRQGGKYPDSWHYKHMLNPELTSPGSIMPKYPWIVKENLDRNNTVDKMAAMRKLGVPYDEELDKQKVMEEMDVQAAGIVESLKGDDIKNVDKDKEIVALIAYLQRMGTDIKGSPASTAETDYTNQDAE